ncbi:MAG: glycine cleavage T C-terminal barrel domain-containing protein [Pyrinomonadaceae bacterium]
MDIESAYDHVRSGGTGSYEQKRGLIAVWGKEANQFLDGLISNDMKTLEDGGQMLAAFPNAQGRLLAVVRVLREGDRFLFETENTTRVKVFDNLFRFTYAGDFFVEDLSEQFGFFEVFGDVTTERPAHRFTNSGSTGYFILNEFVDEFRKDLIDAGAVKLSGEVHEIIRIENGVPLFGVDMDEATIVPELGLEGLISYNKGCYIGQEIIARIHFRGHVAKRLTGLIFETEMWGNGENGMELTSQDGKAAGSIRSTVFSPKLGKSIALAYVRYDYLAEGTQLGIGSEAASVASLPFVSSVIKPAKAI